jgi:hypothetical protein
MDRPVKSGFSSLEADLKSVFVFGVLLCQTTETFSKRAKNVPGTLAGHRVGGGGWLSS